MTVETMKETPTMTSAAVPIQYSQPTLPPLYFGHSMWSSSAATECHTTHTICSSSSSTSDNPQLPAELLSQCLTNYADWGDLAKLACVQKAWSSVLEDASNYNPESKWELAQAMLNGDCGLEANPQRAMELMKDVSKVPISVDTEKPCLVSIEQETQTNESKDVDTALHDNDLPSMVSPYFAPAMKAIAKCYFTGQGVQNANPDVGMAWLQASHEYGQDADAAHEMALAYEYGHYGIETDVVAAAVWFAKAANAGHVEAMAELGLCYELGCGVEQSDTEALDWYTKAANAGHVTSKFSVGEAFEEARGVPQSDEEACLWYYRAAVVGDEDSKIALRRLYDIARIVVPGVAEILNE